MRNRSATLPCSMPLAAHSGWLAAQYGISPTTVSRALQHHGVTIRRLRGGGFGDDIDQNYVRFFAASRAAQRITE